MRVSSLPNPTHIFVHKFDNFIQILLGPIANFKWRTPTDCYPEGAHPSVYDVVCQPGYI